MEATGFNAVSVADFFPRLLDGKLIEKPSTATSGIVTRNSSWRSFIMVLNRGKITRRQNTNEWLFFCGRMKNVTVVLIYYTVACHHVSLEERYLESGIRFMQLLK